MAYVLFIVFCAAITLLFVVLEYIRTCHLKRYMNMRAEKAKIYAQLVKINNQYIKLLISGKLKKYPMVKAYLSTTQDILDSCGSDMDLTKLIINETTLEEGKNEQKIFDKFMKEVKRSPKDIKDLVRKKAFLFEQIVKIKKPMYYKSFCLKRNFKLNIISFKLVILKILLSIITVNKYIPVAKNKTHNSKVSRKLYSLHKNLNIFKNKFVNLTFLYLTKL